MVTKFIKVSADKREEFEKLKRENSDIKKVEVYVNFEDCHIYFVEPASKNEMKLSLAIGDDNEEYEYIT